MSVGFYRLFIGFYDIQKPMISRLFIGFSAAFIGFLSA
jgi:hypothetical protein